MPPESPYLSDERLNQAYKIDHLVNEGKISSTEASEASRREIDEMVATIFDKHFSQNYFQPWEMQKKTLGQKAEDILVDMLNLFPWFQVRHGTDREDAVRKTDLVLTVAGTEQTIPIQLTTNPDRRVIREKRRRLPHDVLLITLPLDGIQRAYRKHDEQSFRNIIERFVRQLLEQLQKLPEYLTTYEGLHEQLEPVAA